MCSTWRAIVIFFVCGLTLAASGGDICLLRIVVSCPSTKTVSLDASNADFTASAKTSESISQSQSGDVSPASLLLVMTTVPSSLLLTPSANVANHYGVLPTPLRC